MRSNNSWNIKEIIDLPILWNFDKGLWANVVSFRARFRLKIFYQVLTEHGILLLYGYALLWVSVGVYLPRVRTAVPIATDTEGSNPQPGLHPPSQLQQAKLQGPLPQQLNDPELEQHSPITPRKPPTARCTATNSVSWIRTFMLKEDRATA